MDRRDFVNKGALAALAAGAGSIFSRASAGEGETSAAHRNVKSFGARGDGKTDDSAAIEKALASDAGTLVFDRGVYKLSRTIVVDLSKRGWTSINGSGGARVLMAAAGPAFHFIGTHKGTAEPDSVSELTWNRERLPLVENIEILGDHEEA
ncbi:MAG: glycosyl hydrolase family 28-related protein, partial [Planctomycetota bacterium]|nr:glycosyl hydrolase family 28-related protein [Planctomycetota bacterium]